MGKPQLKPKLSVSDVDLWVKARARFAGQHTVQIPLDAGIYRLEEGAWIDARVWVDYEEKENKG